MFKKIIVIFFGCLLITAFASGPLIAQNAREFLKQAIKERIPSEDGPAAKYIQISLNQKGHKCYTYIIPSSKYKNKYYIHTQQLHSTGAFNRENFTSSAIISAAILSGNVRWKCSDLFLGYSNIFKMENKNNGCAVISIEECIKARKVYMDTGNVDKFTSYWQSKIKYISDADPEPSL